MEHKPGYILRITPNFSSANSGNAVPQVLGALHKQNLFFFFEKPQLQLNLHIPWAHPSENSNYFSTKSSSHLCVKHCMPVDYNFLLKRRGYSRTLSFSSSPSAEWRPRSAYFKKPKIWKSVGAKLGLWAG